MDNYYDEIASGYDELHASEQKKKLDIIKKHIKPKKKDRLLDVGCGTGASSDFSCIVYAIDPSKELLGIFLGKIKSNNIKKIKIFHGDAENLPFENGFFDYVISLTAIQNFDDIKKGLEEIKRVGKNRFALSFLKRSQKKEMILKLIKEIFSEFNIKMIEEEKDMIEIISKTAV